MAKVLILAGDAAEDLETMYVKYRLSEAGHEPYVSAPTTRPIKLVVHDFEPDFDTYVEKPGRSCPVDVAFADVEPCRVRGDRDPGREGAGVHPRRSGRQADRRALLRRGEARGDALPRAAGTRRARSAPRQALVGLPAARSGHPAGGRRVRRRRGRGRREHGLVPRAGATLPTGRGRSSSASTARPFPPSRHHKTSRPLHGIVKPGW